MTSHSALGWDFVIGGFLRATEHAAAAVLPLIGSGDSNGIDGVAVAELRRWLDLIDVDGRVVVGEGEKDDAPMLFVGERFGTLRDGGAARPPLGTGVGVDMAVDIAVDPVDGTKLAGAGRPDSVAVIAVAPRGALLDIGPAYYLEKLVASADGIGLALDAPLSLTLGRLAETTGRRIEELTVAVQDRPRNERRLREAGALGARVLRFTDGDVAVSLRAAASDGDVDLMIGIGGAPEGVLTAAAVRALGGCMQARLAPQSEAERDRVVAAGYSTDRVYGLAELCSDDAWLVLSAVTETRLSPALTLSGVVSNGEVIAVESVVVGPGRVPVVSRNLIGTAAAPPVR